LWHYAVTSRKEEGRSREVGGMRKKVGVQNCCLLAFLETETETRHILMVDGMGWLAVPGCLESDTTLNPAKRR
jgi:hypothetical protein